MAYPEYGDCRDVCPLYMIEGEHARLKCAEEMDEETLQEEEAYKWYDF